MERIALIADITQAILEKLKPDEFEHFFKCFNVYPKDLVTYEDYGESWVDAKRTLQKLNNDTLKTIAEELELSLTPILTLPPKNWENTTMAKAFISHTSEQKNIAKRLRDELRPHNIDAFVAHEDIKPSEEWEKEIDRALKTMDFFISIHTEGFNERTWCQQEIGYAVARNIKIIPVKFDGKQDPQGFIGKIQALARAGKDAQSLALDIIEILKTDKKTKILYEEKIYVAPPVDDDEIPF